MLAHRWPAAVGARIMATALAPFCARHPEKTPDIGAPLSAFFESATSDQCFHTLSYSMLLLLTLASGGVSECEIPSREIMLS